MIRFSLTDFGGAGNVDIAQAALVGYCAPGPLKELLANPLALGSIVWADLLLDPRLSVHVTPGGTGNVDPGAGGYRFMDSPNQLRLTVASGELIIELRYNPTAVR